MAINALVKVALDVYVNFYEVASVEAEDKNVLIVLKSGHKVALSNTTVDAVNKRITAHLRGDTGMGYKRGGDSAFDTDSNWGDY